MQQIDNFILIRFCIKVSLKSKLDSITIEIYIVVSAIHMLNLNNFGQTTIM